MVQGVTGHAMPAMGEILLDLEFSGVTYSQPFVVMKGVTHTPGHFLLGYNFMVHSGASLHPQSNNMQLNGKKYNLLPHSLHWHASNPRYNDDTTPDGQTHCNTCTDNTMTRPGPDTTNSSDDHNLSTPMTTRTPPNIPFIPSMTFLPTPMTKDDQTTIPDSDELADNKVPVSDEVTENGTSRTADMSVNTEGHLARVQTTDRITDSKPPDMDQTSAPGPSDKDQKIDPKFSWSQDADSFFVCVNTVTVKPFHTLLVDVKAKVKSKANCLPSQGTSTALVLPEFGILSNICVPGGLYRVENGKAQIHVINMSKKAIALNHGTKVTNLELTNLPIRELDFPDTVFCGAGSTVSETQATQEQVNIALSPPPDFPKGNEILSKLLNKFPEILPSDSKPLGKTQLLEHTIELTKDATPVCIPSYRIPHARRKILESEIDGMLRAGLIEASTSPWCSPMLLVPKSDGTFRPVVDYRDLNKVTVPQNYPMPDLKSLLQDIKTDSAVFSSIDLAKGFLQVPLAESSRPLTAFGTHVGHFQFRVAPMGLRNSPMTFCRLMNIVLQGLLPDGILAYLDDILICSKTVEEHSVKLEKVFRRLAAAGLTINPSKCRFFQKELLFLGHSLSKDGIRPNDAKVKAIKDFPRPTNQKSVLSFLGLAGFYRCFVPKYGSIAAPLTNLLKKTTEWKWGSEEESAFKTLKDKLVAAPVLVYPDYKRPFHLFTDASAVGLGATLMQNPKGKLNAVAYASRQLNKAQRNYSATERELLAIVWALQHFKQMLLGYKVIVHTDHQALTSALHGKDPYGRKARYQLVLGEFDLDIVYVRGKDNLPPDALSRASLPAQTTDQNIAEESPSDFPPSLANAQVRSVRIGKNPKNNTREVVHMYPAFPVPGVPLEVLGRDSIQLAQSRDDTLSKIIQSLEQDRPPPDVKGLPVHEFTLDDGLLQRVKKVKRIRGRKGVAKQTVVIPDTLVEPLLKLAHEGNGHIGFTKTLHFIRDRCFVPRLVSRVKHHISKCEVCPLYKGDTSAPAPIGSYDIPHRPWHRVFCDTLQFPRSLKGNRYLVVFIDQFSRSCELVVVPDKSAESIAKALFDNIIHRHGTPSYLVHDNGSEFVNSILQELCTKLNIKQVNILPYRPQANGLAERLNQSILGIIRTLAYSGKSNWCEFIPAVQGSLNGTYHSSLKDTPDFLMNGHDKRMPWELIEKDVLPLYTDNYAERLVRETQSAYKRARQNLMASQSRIMAQQHKGAKEKDIRPGSHVYHQIEVAGNIRGKLDPKFEGPYRVLSVHNNRAVCRHMSTMKSEKFHFDTLKLTSDLINEGVL